jgi:hypothetical protein
MKKPNPQPASRLILTVIFFGICLTVQSQQRQKLLMDFGWKFIQEDQTDAQRFDFDDLQEVVADIYLPVSDGIARHSQCQKTAAEKSSGLSSMVFI